MLQHIETLLMDPIPQILMTRNLKALDSVTLEQYLTYDCGILRDVISFIVRENTPWKAFAYKKGEYVLIHLPEGVMGIIWREKAPNVKFELEEKWSFKPVGFLLDENNLDPNKIIFFAKTLDEINQYIKSKYYPV